MRNVEYTINIIVRKRLISKNKERHDIIFLYRTIDNNIKITQKIIKISTRT